MCPKLRWKFQSRRPKPKLLTRYQNLNNSLRSRILLRCLASSLKKHKGKLRLKVFRLLRKKGLSAKQRSVEVYRKLHRRLLFSVRLQHLRILSLCSQFSHSVSVKALLKPVLSVLGSRELQLAQLDSQANL